MFDVIYNVYNNLINPIFDIFNIISMQLVKRVSTFETMAICDGIISTSLNYNLNIIDRYSLYALTNIISYIYPNSVYLSIFLVIPRVQNFITNNRYIQIYHQNQKVFLYYFISKSAITFIKSLNSKFIEIKNYQIFVLYKYISFTLVVDFFKSFLFLQFIYLLRSFESTYYYYKVIKLGYYYTSGYLFNSITEDNAIYTINLLIKERRWYDISKIEYVHALYSLIDLKYQVNKKRIVDVYNSYIFYFFSLWSIISLMKWFNMYFNLGVFSFYVVSMGDPIVPCIIYTLMLIDINDIIIALVASNYKLVYYFLYELFFFVYNIQDIKKVIERFDQTEKPIYKALDTNDNFVIVTDITKQKNA
jgi:hypothetical protein